MRTVPSRSKILIFLLLATVLSAITLLGTVRPDIVPSEVLGFLAGVAAGVLVGLSLYYMLPRWWRAASCAERESKAGRQYLREMIPAMAVYAVLTIASALFIKNGIASISLRAVVALLPVLPIILFLRAFIRYLRNADEFHRMVEMEATGVAALIVAVLYMSGGFLQLAKVIHLDAGQAMIWVFPIMCFGYGIGKFLAMRRYQ